ncbi:MAG: PAS domain S-box protein [Rectinemataceae bacterium]
MSADRLSDQTAELRRRAEEELREKLGQGPLAAGPGPLSVAESEFNLLELQIHQIELEMQNEELRRSQEALEVMLSRYFDLYDQAPICYLTLSEKGLIIEANLAAATSLGMERRALERRVFSYSIARDEGGVNYHEIFYKHRKGLFETGQPQSCELCMEKADGKRFWVQIASTLARDADGKPVQRVILSDIDERKRAELAFKFLKDDLENQVLKRTAEVRNLAISVTRAEERERQFIARDLHDGIGQLLHVILLKSEGLGSLDLKPKSLVLCKELDDLLREAIRMVGSVTSRLSPPVLATFGLVPAFSWLAEDLGREYGLRVHLQCEEMPEPFPEELSLVLLRSARELLINVAKHSGQLEAWLGLSRGYWKSSGSIG